MAKLKDIDAKAEQKGAGVKTFWQFVKFIIVSLLAFVVQFALLNLLQLIPALAELKTQAVDWFVFSYSAQSVNEAGEIIGVGGLCFAIASNVSNIAAQIVSFFVNRKKTFNANNNIPVTLTIYLLFTVALIVFAAWLNPTIKELIVNNTSIGDTLAGNISTFACCFVQFVVYFPVDKILMRQKKTAQ